MTYKLISKNCINLNLGLALLIAGLVITSCQNPETSQDEEQADATDTPQTTSPKSSSGQSETLTDLYQYGIDTTGQIPEGLATGQKAPTFDAETAQGESLYLQKLLKEGPLVLMFYRGQWCPVCNKYLQSFEDSVNLIREAGAQILAVTPETPENAQKMREQTGTSVTIVADTSETIMEQYQVAFDVTGAYANKIEKGLNVNIANNNGDQKARLPVPATYIINQDGRIAWQFFNPNYKQRASVKKIVEALNNMD